MTIKMACDIMSQSYVQGGSNGFSVLSHGSQLVAELMFKDVVGKYNCSIRLMDPYMDLFMYCGNRK